MQENLEKTTNEVSPEEIKAFMNEPEPEPEKPAPPPLMVDDWEKEDKPKDFRLTTEEIAAVAYHAVQMADASLGMHGGNGWVIWEHLEDHIQSHHIGVANFYMNSAANPNGHEACQALHDLMLDAKLHDGWTYGEAYSEEGKTDPTLLSYKGLPMHLKTRNFLFRCVVVGLIAVWKGH